MGTINTLIKWPGGKAREIKYIEKLIPDFDRYIEPFFGGGALFFFLAPQKAIINDISRELTDFYRLVKEQNSVFYSYLRCYDKMMSAMLFSCEKHYDDLYDAYNFIKDHDLSSGDITRKVHGLTNSILSGFEGIETEKLVLNREKLYNQLNTNAVDKIKRTVKNETKSPFSPPDLKENLITGYMSGLYMYFRDVYNDIRLGRLTGMGKEYNTANFYYVREYCYGSMFRFNSKGEFNIPYGGMTYNRKRLETKIENIFSEKTQEIFAGTSIYCMDFEELMAEAKLTERDFVFLDPPYDTDFSDYDGKQFTKADHERLAEVLKKAKAKFVLIIKNTEYIHSLYENDFNILFFDKTYTYNVRSRNKRYAEHLIVTNMPV